MDNFCKRLKELRTEKNYSFKTLGSLTGLGKSSLERWENGKTDIKSRELMILASFFAVSVDYLLGLEDY